MRLYGKLVLMTVLACAVQVTLRSDVAEEGYFTFRCLVAARSGNELLERQLVAEYQQTFSPERPCNITTIAMYERTPG